MKEFYSKPLVELNKFDKKDVVTTSGKGSSENTDDPNAPWTDLF
jgi:hypothetical protein